jgi:hypothetical protein
MDEEERDCSVICIMRCDKAISHCFFGRGGMCEMDENKEAGR